MGVINATVELHFTSSGPVLLKNIVAAFRCKFIGELAEGKIVKFQIAEPGVRDHFLWFEYAKLPMKVQDFTRSSSKGSRKTIPLTFVLRYDTKAKQPILEHLLHRDKAVECFTNEGDALKRIS